MPDTKQIITRYYKLKNPVTNGHETTHLKVELYYSLGGYNCFTSKSETRGYVISVSPVGRYAGLESYIVFTGKKYCLVPVQRQSKKAKEEAKTKLWEGCNCNTNPMLARWATYKLQIYHKSSSTGVRVLSPISAPQSGGLALKGCASRVLTLKARRA